MGTEPFSSAGWDEDGELSRWQVRARTCRSRDVYYGTGIRALLPAIGSPTAVLHREQDTAAGFDLGREVASLSPGAQLASAASCRSVPGPRSRRGSPSTG
jgi:hypothetical protein